jgi:FkbM family methyltransferase
MSKRPWLHRLARLAYPYGSVRRVWRGPLRGMRYRVERGMGMTFAWGAGAAHWDWLRRQRWEGRCVYDVGANRGQSALFFARLVGQGGTVVSFEPVKDVFDDLVFNVRLNGLTQVRPICAAVADRAGTASFAFDPGASTQGKLTACEPSYAPSGAKSLAVSVCTLDDLAGRELPPPHCLKVDAEGAAAAVFRGASRTLAEFCPTVYIELHGPEEQQGVRELIREHGYTAQTLDGRVVPDPTVGWHSPLWCVPKGAPALNF